MCKESETNVNDMTMLAFSGAVLLVDVRTRHVVFNPKLTEKGVEPLVLATPIHLHANDLMIK